MCMSMYEFMCENVPMRGTDVNPCVCLIMYELMCECMGYR